MEIVFDALKDSAGVFVFVFLFHLVFSFFETRMASFLVSGKRFAPVFGALFGLIPQCAASVLGADIFERGFITTGTLLAIFLSCSDEAVIVLFSSGAQTRAVLPVLLLLKFSIGASVGLLADKLMHSEISSDAPELSYEGHSHSESALVNYVLHPLYHAIELFFYVFSINLILNAVISLSGENVFTDFIMNGRFLAPLFAAVVGLVPNCASSVLLSELFADGSISLGALTGGLLANSGLGIIVLFKKKKTFRKALSVTAVGFCIAVVSGYAICFVNGF